MAPVRPVVDENDHRRETDELRPLHDNERAALLLRIANLTKPRPAPALALPPVPPPPCKAPITPLDRIQTAAELVIAAAEGVELPRALQEALELLRRELEAGHG